jgi:hypothetical protein
MRTSLNEIKEIESYLLDLLEPGERLVFETRMVLNKKLRRDVALQQKTYAVIQYHFRSTLKNEFEHHHAKLFNDPSRVSLKSKILNLFKS